MQNKRLLSALKKAGFEVSVKQDSHDQQIVVGETHTLTWYVREGEVDLLHICPNGLESDSYTDYFPGSFCSTIKRAVDAVSRKAKAS